MNTIANADLGFGLPFGSDMPFLSQSPGVLMVSHKFLTRPSAKGRNGSLDHMQAGSGTARSAYVVYFLGVGSADR